MQAVQSCRLQGFRPARRGILRGQPAPTSGSPWRCRPAGGRRDLEAAKETAKTRGAGKSAKHPCCKGIHTTRPRRRAGSDKKYFLAIYKNNCQNNILLTQYILRNSSLTTLFFRLATGCFTADINLAATGQGYLRATVSDQPEDNCPEPRSDSHCCGPM